MFQSKPTRKSENCFCLTSVLRIQHHFDSSTVSLCRRWPHQNYGRKDGFCILHIIKFVRLQNEHNGRPQRASIAMSKVSEDIVYFKECCLQMAAATPRKIGRGVSMFKIQVILQNNLISFFSVIFRSCKLIKSNDKWTKRAMQRVSGTRNCQRYQKLNVMDMRWIVEFCAMQEMSRSGAVDSKICFVRRSLWPELMIIHFVFNCIPKYLHRVRHVIFLVLNEFWQFVGDFDEDFGPKLMIFHSRNNNRAGCITSQVVLSQMNSN